MLVSIYTCHRNLTADELEEWDFIGDSDAWEVASGISFRPPVSKSSAVLPPPGIQHYPRSPARLQVPAALQQLTASRGALTTEHISHTSCRLTVQDVTLHEQQRFGTLVWKGKCLDLEKAYRQVPVSSCSLFCSVALVHKPDGEANYFVSQSLPFGACSSVYARFQSYQ